MSSSQCLLQHFRLSTLRMQSAPARDGAIASDVRVCGQARYTNTSSIQRLLDKEEELETELVNFHSKLMLKTCADVLKHKNRTWWSPFSRATSFGYLFPRCQQVSQASVDGHGFVQPHESKIVVMVHVLLIERMYVNPLHPPLHGMLVIGQFLTWDNFYRNLEGVIYEDMEGWRIYRATH